MNIQTLKVILKFLPYLLYVSSWLGLFAYGYYEGSNNTKEKYELLIKEETIKYSDKITSLQQEVFSKEREKWKYISELMYENEQVLDKEKEQYENTINTLRTDNVKLSGLLNASTSKSTCSDMRKATNNTEEVVCYKRSELLQKIEETLHIGVECDSLANDYNTLLKICTYNNDGYINDIKTNTTTTISTMNAITTANEVNNDKQ